MPDPITALRDAPKPVANWYSITNEATTEGDITRAKVNIFDAIGGWWGVSAAEFVEQLDSLDVDELEVHVNSPGGAVWDGIAIMNALKAHRAKVVVIVDGLAASAASIVAMAGDEVVMAEGSQMMIHQASGGVWGNADYIRDMAAILDKIDNNLAGIYARRTGATRASWLDLMRAETWYNADEAVEAGLADRADSSLEGVDAEAAFDLSIFNYAGRSKAPAPAARGLLQVSNTTGRRVVALTAAQLVADTQTPVSSEPGKQNKEKDIMSDIMTGLRDRLGVTNAEADEATILAALDEALAERAEPTNASLPEGVVAIESETLASLRADAAAGREARDQQTDERRARLVEAAIEDGRISAKRRDHWVAQLAADEEGAAEVLASLEPNTIPLEPKGYTGGVNEASDDDALYAKVAGAAITKKEN